MKKAGSIFMPSNEDNEDFELEYKPNTFQLQAALLF